MAENPPNPTVASDTLTLASGPRVAIVHDYLTQRGGAERVVLSMLRAFPQAELHTSFYDPSGTFAEFAGYDVRTMGINAIPPLRRHHRLALPLLKSSFSGYVVDADVVLCSSSGWAHGVVTQGRKIVYCYTPARWLYQSEQYLGRDSLRASRSLARWGLRLVHDALVEWDQLAAQTADAYLAISQVVRDRIAAQYGIDAEIVPPPQTLDAHGPMRAVSGVTPGHLLTVSRLLPYKNIDVIMDAMQRLSDAVLVVAGTGPQEAVLRRLAPSNVHILGMVTDAELRWLYANCAGLVAASFEDYGLTTLEAAAFGRPAAVLRYGGYLDTVLEGQTGVFFDRPSPSAIAASIRALLGRQWDRKVIRRWVSRFSEDAFVRRLREIALTAVNTPDVPATLRSLGKAG